MWECWKPAPSPRKFTADFAGRGRFFCNHVTPYSALDMAVSPELSPNPTQRKKKLFDKLRICRSSDGMEFRPIDGVAAVFSYLQTKRGGPVKSTVYVSNLIWAVVVVIYLHRLIGLDSETEQCAGARLQYGNHN